MPATKNKVPPAVTREEAIDSAKQYASITHRLSAVKAQMNKEINAVRNKHETEMEELTEALAQPFQMLETYAAANWESWDKKSTDLIYCIIGYRAGRTAVDKEEDHTWDEVLDALRKASLKKFIRVKEEVDKPAIAAEKNTAMVNRAKECYIVIRKDEFFFAEPKEES